MRKSLKLITILCATLLIVFLSINVIKAQQGDNTPEVECDCRIFGSTCRANGWGATCVTKTENCAKRDRNCAR